jgi:ADP-ribose pyrophosphatase
MKLDATYKERFRKTLHRYDGRAVGFRADVIGLPEGKAGTREYLVHPGAVGVLAFDAQGRILLVKQYRYPIGQFTYEIPAGKLSPGEKPLACVGRELEEETGFKARKVKKLVAYWPTAAFSNEIIHLYLAKDLVETQPDPDDDEFIELVRVSPRELERWIKRGKIQDSKTLIAYLAWKSLYR